MNNGKNLPKYWNVIILFPVFYAPTINLFPHSLPLSLPQSTNSRKSESIKFEVNFDKKNSFGFLHTVFSFGRETKLVFPIADNRDSGGEVAVLFEVGSRHTFCSTFLRFCNSIYCHAHL